MKQKITSFCFSLLFILIVKSGHSIEPIAITWENLIPQLPAQENSLAGLTEEEAGFLEWIIYLREYLPEEIKPKDQKFHDEMTSAMSQFSEKGIDVDAIIADRRYRATAVNNDLNGKAITMAGYLLPLDLSGGKVTDFLLVPWVGACIHTPPPPPNQIVHAVTVEARSYELDSMFAPVSVTGVMEVRSLTKELFLVDGSSDIDVGYNLKVQNIEKYQQK